MTSRTIPATKVKLGSSDRRSLRLAVVADTHAHPHPNAAAMLEGMHPDAILHAGDIGDLAVLSTLAAIAPVHAVRGNIDAAHPTTPDLLVLDAETATGAVRILLLHIALVGPKLRADISRLAKEHNADFVVCGHSHVPFIGRDRGLVVFNPGSVGPRRFTLPILLGSIDLDEAGLRLRHFDCETGAAWLPP